MPSAAKQQAQRDWTGFGEGFRTDARHLAHDLRGRVPSSFEWGVPPWRHEPTAGERLRAWGADRRGDRGGDRRRARHGPSRRARAARARGRRGRDGHAGGGGDQAGGTAIDAGVSKVVDGGRGAAIGSAAAVAAGSTAVKTAVVDRAKVELDERVVAPAKKKAIIFGVARRDRADDLRRRDRRGRAARRGRAHVSDAPRSAAAGSPRAREIADVASVGFVKRLVARDGRAPPRRVRGRRWRTAPCSRSCRCSRCS